MRTVAYFSILFSLIIGLNSCERKTEDFVAEKPSEYFALQTGKYITYRLDSTVFWRLNGRSVDVNSYQEKHLVDAQMADNLGRTSYRIYRFIRDTAGLQPWAPSGSYFITPGNNTVEVIENNLRMIALAGPVKEGTTWNPNQFFPLSPYTSLYPELTATSGIEDWESKIENTGGHINMGSHTHHDVISINTIEEYKNVPLTDPNEYGSKLISKAKYAKGLGLVYQDYSVWEYQPPRPGVTAYRVGFEVKRQIIDHN